MGFILLYCIHVVVLSICDSMLCVSGTGATKEGAVEKCGVCRGTGTRVQLHQLGPGMMQQIQSMCNDCKGRGERVNPKFRCKECSGDKVVRERKILEVHVDKGN